MAAKSKGKGLVIIIGPAKGIEMGKTRRYTKEEDDAEDRKMGIKEGSARDKKLDRKHGVPELPKKKSR